MTLIEALNLPVVNESLDFVSFVSLSMTCRELSQNLKNEKYWTFFGRRYFPGKKIETKQAFFKEAKVIHVLLNNRFNTVEMCSPRSHVMLHFYSMGYFITDPKFTRISVQEALDISSLQKTSAVIKNFKHLAFLKVELQEEDKANAIKGLIMELPELQSITLITPSLNDEVLEVVALKQPGLKHLKIVTLAEISEKSLKAISKLEKLQTLIFLTIGKPFESIQVISALKRMKELTILHFEGAKGWTGHKILKLLRGKRVENLRLNGVKSIRNHHLRSIAQAPMTSLCLQDLPSTEYRFKGHTLKYYELRQADQYE